MLKMRQRLTIRIILLLTCVVFTGAAGVLAQLPPHRYPNDLAWSPDGVWIAVCGPGYLLVKDPATAATVLDLPVGETDVANLSWSPDSQKLISSAEAKAVRVWNVAFPDYIPGELLTSIESRIRGIIAYVGWSPDGRYIAISYSLANGIDLWDANTSELVKVISGGGHTFAWNPNQSINQIASSFFSEEGPSIITLTDPPVIIKPVGGRDIPALKLAWSPDGTKLAAAYADGPTVIWDITTNTQISMISSGSDGSERSLSWGPDNQTLVTASGNGTVSLWNADTGALISTTAPFTGVIAAISPDGKQIAFAWEYGKTQIVELAQLAQVSPALTLTPTPVSFRPDATEQPRR